MELSHVLAAQSRPTMGKRVGEDGLVAEVLQELPWATVETVKDLFGRRCTHMEMEQWAMESYDRVKANQDTWRLLRVVLVGKQRTFHWLSETRPLCKLSAVAKWYSGTLLEKLAPHDARTAAHSCLALFSFEEGHSCE